MRDMEKWCEVCLSSFCTGGSASGKSVYDLDGPRTICLNVQVVSVLDVHFPRISSSIGEM